MEKINKFLFDYVKKVNSLTNRRAKTVDSVIPKSIQKEFKESLNAIAFRDFVIRDLFEMSMRQSAGHFVALEKATWNQFQNKYELQLFSINSDWSFSSENQSDVLNIHRRIYKEGTANAVITCHPIEIYELFFSKVEYKDLEYLPKSDTFNEFMILTEKEIMSVDVFNRLTFSNTYGLTSWGKSLFEAINQIELLIFGAKLALMQNKT